MPRRWKDDELPRLGLDLFMNEISFTLVTQVHEKGYESFQLILDKVRTLPYTSLGIQLAHKHRLIVYYVVIELLLWPF